MKKTIVKIVEVDPLLEACKLPLRLLVLALLPFLIAYLTEVNYEWAGFATGLLVFLDKYLHEIWKIEGTGKKGIVPF